MSTFRIEVVTPDRTAFEGDAESLTVPAWEGYLGVLANHAPLLTVLQAGVVTMKTDQKARFFAVRGGFMEVRQNRAVILADDFVAAEELRAGDIARDRQAAEAPPAPVEVEGLADRERLRVHQAEQRQQALAWATARETTLRYLEGGAPV